MNEKENKFQQQHYHRHHQKQQHHQLQQQQQQLWLFCTYPQHQISIETVWLRHCGSGYYCCWCWGWRGRWWWSDKTAWRQKADFSIIPHGERFPFPLGYCCAVVMDRSAGGDPDSRFRDASVRFLIPQTSWEKAVICSLTHQDNMSWWVIFLAAVVGLAQTEDLQEGYALLNQLSLWHA